MRRLAELRSGRRALLRLGLAWAFSAGAGAVPGCRPTVPAEAESGPVRLLKTPDAGIQPQAALDARGTLHLLYFRGDPAGGDLYYRRRQGARGDWSDPIRVNDPPGTAVAIGTIRGGQLAVGPGGRAHIVWFGNARARPRAPLDPALPVDRPFDGAPLLYTRLDDAGSAFEPPRNLMRATFGLDGGPSVAADLRGNVFVLWHAHDARGRGEEARRLWIARSPDEGKSFGPETPAWEERTGACPCCSVEAFADSRGNLYALYRMARNRTERDMVLLTSADGGRSFSGARLDPWPIDT